MEVLYKKLEKYEEKDIYPMHMPGHKRNALMLPMNNAYTLDITEIDGFDNLHDAQEIILDSMERAAKLYGAEHTFYLVNGSTVGILAGIMGCTKKGDQVLVARNCHKAVYNALVLQELVPIYMYPHFNTEVGIYEEITPETVEEAVKQHPDIKAIILTSPTYEGVVSDIEKIATVAHESNIPLIVDEAHGAHLGFHDYFPESAIKNGADVIIHSVHKTMPAFTQTALLHVMGTLVNVEQIKRYLQMLQSSSPSYVLLGGIDRCIDIIEQQGIELFDLYQQRLKIFYDAMKQLKNLTIYEAPSNKGVERDPSKLVISTKGTDVSAVWLYEELLHTYQIQMELVSKDYVLGMTSFCDTSEGMERFTQAILEIDRQITTTSSYREVENLYHIPKLELCYCVHEALEQEEERCELEQSTGKISKEFIYLYPPGIPIVVPGERISKELVSALEIYKELGLQLKGLEDKTTTHVKIIKEV